MINVSTNNTSIKKEAIKYGLKSGTFLARTALATLGAIAISSPAHAVGDFESFSGGDVKRGSATIQENFGATNVNQSSQLSVIEWQSTNVGKSASLNITSSQANSASAHINVGGSTNPSKILGTINSDGRVVIVDRNGVIFGKDSIVNVAGLVAATGSLDYDKFMTDGTSEFSNFGANSEIVNKGTITVADHGLAAFVAPTVKNSGIITARLGRVELAGTTQVTTVDLYGDGLIEIAVGTELADTLVKNSGTINAESGIVHMTATAASGVVDNIINMTGVVSVASATQEGGKIVLGGNADSGQVRVAGELDASGATSGGEISVEGETVKLTNNANIKANGANGSVTVVTDELDVAANASVEATGDDATVTIGRLTDGDISLGDDQGGLVVSQAIVDIISAANLVLGRNDAADNNVTEVNVQNIDTTASISDKVTLNAMVGNDADVEFDGGTNTFNSLEANSTDDIVMRAGSNVETTVGDIVFRADVDANETTGDSNKVEFHGSGSATLTSAGDIVFAGRDYTSRAADTIVANGGDGTVTFERTSSGAMSVGDDNGGYHVSQVELDNISAGKFVFGNNLVTTLTLEEVDTLAAAGAVDAIASSLVSLGAVAANGLNVTGSDVEIIDTVDLGSNAFSFTNSAGDFLSLGNVTADADDATAEITNDDLDNLVAGSLVLSTENGNVDVKGMDARDFDETEINAGNNADFRGNNRFNTLTVNADNNFNVNGGALKTRADDLTVNAGGYGFVASDASILSDGGNIDITTGSTGFFSYGTVSASDGEGAGNVSITTVGNIQQEAGSIIGNVVTLNTDSIVLQKVGSQIVANTLTGSAASYARLQGATNQIETLGDFTTGSRLIDNTSFLLVDSDGGLDVAGTVTAAGNVDITTTDGNLDILSGASLTSTGYDVILNNDGGLTRLLGNSSVTAGDDVIVNTRNGFVMGGTSTLTADQLNVIAAAVRQFANSTVDVNSVTGSTRATAEFLGTNNKIGSVDDFATGTSPIQDGGFTLVDSEGGLILAGNVSATGGNVSVTTAGGDLTQNAGTSVTTGGGAATFTSTDGSATFNGTVDATGSDGSITITALNNIQINDGSLIKTEDGVAPFDGSLTLNTTNGYVRQQAGSTIETGSVQGSTGRGFNLRGTANKIAELGDISTGNAAGRIGQVVVKDSEGGLNITGNVSTTGGLIDVDTVGDLDVSGSVDAAGGNVDLFQTGVLTAVADSVRTSGTGTINLIQNDGGSINNAIQAVLNTGTGLNTLTVSAGTFNEDIKVNQDNFLLKGAQFGVKGTETARAGGETVITGQSDSTGAVEITASNVTFDGFTVSGPFEGVHVNGSSSSQLSNVNVLNNRFINNGEEGFEADNVNTLNITNNFFSSAGLDTIEVDDSSNVTIADNIIEIDTNDAIDVDDVTGFVTIVRNMITGDGGSEDGILVDDSENVLIGGSLADANTISNVDVGIEMDSENTGSQEVSFNTVTGSDVGIFIDGDDDVVVDNNTLDGNVTGILIEDSGSTILTNNQILNSTDAGVVFDNTLNTTFTGNTFAGGDQYIRNLGPRTIDARNNTFEINGSNFDPTTVDANNISDAELDILFALEDKTDHALDNASYGLVRYVDDNLFVTQDSGSIQRGVNESGSGDTLWVDAGTFSENVDIAKSLTLMGRQYGVSAKTGVRGTNETVVTASFGDLFDVFADNVTIDGFTFQGGSTGVDVDGNLFGIRDDVTITNNVFSGQSSDNINADWVNRFTVSNNSFDGAGSDNVEVDLGASVNIVDNVFNGSNGDAVDVDNIIGLNLFRNMVNAADDAGFEIDDSVNVVVGGSLANANMISGTERGVVAESENVNLEISFNSFDGNDMGVEVDGDDLVRIDQNTFLNSNNIAISVDDASGTLITTNVFTDNNSNIEIFGGSNNQVTSGNVFNGGFEALYAEGTTDTVFSGNTVNGTVFGVTLIADDDGDGSGGVVSDNVFTGNRDGRFLAIEIDEMDGVSVTDNQVDGYRNGLFAIDANGLVITGNDFAGRFNERGKGIDVRQSDDVTIGTAVGTGGRNVVEGYELGVSVRGGENVTLTNNRVRDNYDGIEVRGTRDLTLDDNRVRRSEGDGIKVENAKGDVSVINNLVVNAGSDGIDINNVNRILVDNNEIRNTGDNGIEIDDSNRAVISNNDISDTEGNGIDLEESNRARITDNTIDGTEEDGIFVEYSDNVRILRNTISNTDGDGIDVENSDDVRVVRNTIADAGDDGIDVDGSEDIRISRNTVTGSSESGIDLFDSEGAVIVDNIVRQSGENGIELEQSDSSFIASNRANRNGLNGISVIDSDDVDIVANKTNRNGAAGIFVDPSDNITVSGNTANNNATGILFDQVTNSRIVNDNTLDGNDVGIKIVDSQNITVDTNTLTDNGTGIEIVSTEINLRPVQPLQQGEGEGEGQGQPINLNAVRVSNRLPSDNITLNNNNVDGGETGVLAAGQGNGTITMTNNTISNNEVGARFESGLIDISDLDNPNTFDGNQTGMQFEPANTDDPFSLTLAGDTFGATSFVNIPAGGLAIELQEGAFFDVANGSPFILDALNVNFDGIIPANSPFGTPGLLTLDQFLTIQSLIVDLNDAAGRGLVFAGFVPGLSEEDIFSTTLTNFTLPGGGFAVTLAGLPFVSEQSAAALNALATAAGGDSAEDLANIETAAGGDDLNCWAEVGQALDGSTSYFQNVSFSFSDDANAALDAAAGCGAQ